MADGRIRETWGHTANLIFWLSEIRRSTGNFKTPPKQMTWQQCYPFAEKTPALKVPITALRDVFCKKKKKTRITTIFTMTMVFFDRDHIIKKIGEAKVKVLSKGGAYIRRAAQTSMRYRKKGFSAPGRPPFAHRQFGALLRKLLFFAYDAQSDSVVVGPVAARKAEVPHLMEFGGTATRRKIMGSRGKVRHVVTRIAHYPPRPFMGPALEKSAPKLPEQWANSVVGP